MRWSSKACRSAADRPDAASAVVARLGVIALPFWLTTEANESLFCRA
jgi:hypothetical protein